MNLTPFSHGHATGFDLGLMGHCEKDVSASYMYAVGSTLCTAIELYVSKVTQKCIVSNIMLSLSCSMCVTYIHSLRSQITTSSLFLKDDHLK